MCITGSFTLRCAAQYGVSHKLGSLLKNYSINVSYPTGIMNAQTCLDFGNTKQDQFAYVSCQQFWLQIRQKRACQSPYLVHQTKIWAHQRLDRRSLLRHTVKVGFGCKDVTHFDARIYQESPTKIQALRTNTTLLPLHSCTKTVKRKSPSPPPHQHLA